MNDMKSNFRARATAKLGSPIPSNTSRRTSPRPRAFTRRISRASIGTSGSPPSALGGAIRSSSTQRSDCSRVAPMSSRSSPRIPLTDRPLGPSAPSSGNTGSQTQRQNVPTAPGGGANSGVCTAPHSCAPRMAQWTWTTRLKLSPSRHKLLPLNALPVVSSQRF